MDVHAGLRSATTSPWGQTQPKPDANSLKKYREDELEVAEKTLSSTGSRAYNRISMLKRFA